MKLKTLLAKRLSEADDLEKIRYILTETTMQIMDVQSAERDLKIQESSFSGAVERLLNAEGER